MVGDMDNQERGNTFVLGHMGDGGKILVLGRVVSEFQPVAIGGLGQAVHAPAGLGHLDNGRNIEGVAIDGNATLDDAQIQSLRLQVAVIGANNGGKLSPRGVAHHEDPLGVAAVHGNVVVGPADGLGHIADDRAHVHLGQQSIIR